MKKIVRLPDVLHTQTQTGRANPQENLTLRKPAHHTSSKLLSRAAVAQPSLENGGYVGCAEAVVEVREVAQGAVEHRGRALAHGVVPNLCRKENCNEDKCFIRIATH